MFKPEAPNLLTFNNL
jgi:hypothetical protein